MNGNTEKEKMDRVVSGVSSLRGLLISNRFLAIILVILQVYFAFNSYRNYTPLYIILLDLLFPLILEGAFKSRAADEASLPFPLLRKKYGFTGSKKKALSYGFLLNVVLIFAWRYGYIANEVAFENAESLPVAVMIAYVTVRLVVWIFYYLSFKFFPAKIMK